MRPFAFRDWSIRTKLLVTYSVLIIIPLTIIGAVAYTQMAQAIERQVGAMSQRLVDLMVKNLEQVMIDINRVAVATFTDSAPTGDPVVLQALRAGAALSPDDQSRFNREIVQHLDNLMAPSPEIVGIYVVPRAGPIYYRTYGRSMKLGYDLRSEPWFTEALHGPDRMVLIPHREPHVFLDPQVVFSLVKQVRDPDTNTLLGFIKVDVRADLLRAVISPIDVDTPQQVLLVDQDGLLVYATDLHNVGQPAGLPFFAEVLSHQRGTLYADYTGGRSLVAFALSERTNWHVISVVSLRELTKDIHGLRNVLAANAIFLVIVAFGVSWGMLAALTIPIRSLRDVMQQAAEAADFGGELKNDSRDEVGQLTRIFGKMRQSVKQMIETTYQARIRTQQAELRALQAQINPHFLYNTLEAIAALAEIEGVAVVGRVARALGDLFRYTIGTNSEPITLSQELDHVHNYLLIQQVRYPDKFSITVAVAPEFLALRMPRLTLQPLVENALYHGLERKRGKGKLSITAHRDQHRVVVVVQDDGVGMTPEKLALVHQQLQRDVLMNEDAQSGQRVGLANVHHRLRLHYGNSYGIEIDSELGVGTTVRVLLPPAQEE